MTSTASCLAVAGLVLVLSIGSRAEADVLLVEGGKPRATIVVGDEATDQAREAASALQTYIERISGAHLPVQSESEAVEGNRVLVGHSHAVDALGITVPSGFTHQLNEEGYVVKTVGDALVLAGNEDWHYRGTMYAVYDLLEGLGCRWFFPGDYGEVLPKLDTVAVDDMDRVERPDFRFRNIWYSGWMPVREGEQQLLRDWLERNRASSLSGLSLPGDGSVKRLAPADKYFETHPHIYAMSPEGERVKDMLCMTEPDAVRIAAETIKEAFRNDPNAISFGFAPPDGHPLCHCERCMAAMPGFMGKGLGDPSLSDLWFSFVQKVAQEVYKEFPDRWLWTNGYANRVRLPESTGPLSPNIGIQSAMISACTFHRVGDERCWQRQLYKQIFDRWTDALDCVFIYDYDPGKGLEGLPFPALHCLKHDMPYFKERGIWGFWTEGNNSWMFTHLNYYVRARLMWDADQSVDALVRDYCERFYGAAARPVERYIWTLENAVDDAGVHETWGRLTPWKHILTDKVVDKLDDLMAKAQRKTDSPDAKLHVKVLGYVHKHMKAFLALQEAADEGDFTGAVGWADLMLAIRDETAKIDPALLPHTPEWCRTSKTTLEWHRAIYEGFAARTGGTEGELVALLPKMWEFRTDPEDIGTFYQWYLPGDEDQWKPIDTTTYWQAQGYQDSRGWGYAGKAWYRTSFAVPEDTANKPLTLTLGGVYSSGLWVWLNGVLIHHSDAHHSRNPVDIDLTGKVRCGEDNHLAILVGTESPGRNERGGLHRRALLWQPREKGE